MQKMRLERTRRNHKGEDMKIKFFLLTSVILMMVVISAKSFNLDGDACQPEQIVNLKTSDIKYSVN